MNREEPGIAKWLLRHFGASANNESVIGDLTERYRDGRSVLAIVCFFLMGMFFEPQYLVGFVKLALGNSLTLPGILVGGGLFSAPPDSPPRRRTILS